MVRMVIVLLTCLHDRFGTLSVPTMQGYAWFHPRSCTSYATVNIVFAQIMHAVQYSTDPKCIGIGMSLERAVMARLGRTMGVPSSGVLSCPDLSCLALAEAYLRCLLDLCVCCHLLLSNFLRIGCAISLAKESRTPGAKCTTADACPG